ncbi:DEAD-box ATP-dependent RNA helicase 46 [Mercurialis annua]|uniref:DEAD-box ATP-dependent RNA helicase 46 n=1 Tax=Mercurialis annua TaxID=3986 RepID=UPI00215DD9E8|nr:DEAD-box ATP-dependent RNA helicase 46 [Mercurialis annua]XP_050227147.1 DEAD-box ATP-dependent RNA helicase 46 [Mercurialis annua]XP_050227148.1 DEAD-box ATP-dependent RNA helicase 46 [Mercurialis annua]
MASTDPSSASAGPRYAPEDPTLPKPWMGLIDGSTGFLYYWNPETNVTQYEKPASVPPPLPLGPPPAVSTPKLAQIPTVHSSQLNGLAPQTMPKSTLQQQGQQTSQLPLQAQATQQQGHENSQLSQQHGQLMPLKQGLPVTQVNQPVVQQPGSHLTHGIQQSGQPRSQMMQQPVQQMFPHMGQQVSQHGGQQFAQQPMQQMPQQSGQHMLQHQSLQMPQQGQQYTYQHYMTYQQSMLPQDQQSSQQQFPNQSDHKTAFAKRGEIDISQGKQTNFSPSHFQQAGAPSSLNLPAAGNPVSMAQGGAHSGQPQQFNGSSVNMQPATLAQKQQSGTDLVHQQHGPRFHNHLGPLMLQNHPSNVPNTHGGGTSSDYYVSAKTERPPIMGPIQSNIPALPMSRNQQESRMDVPYQNASPGYAGGFNSTGHTMHNMYNHASGHTPFPNNAIVRPPSVGVTDVTNLSPTEAYCQTHEVTATGGNVPAPYITFEATGFPHEILYDIRKAGFSAPTPIQAQTWPIALQNRDIVAIAKTGSGKTLGYLIPAFILLRQRCNNSQNGPTVLVLAPTRELATQIQDEVIKFGQSSKVSCTCLYGGTPKANQLRDLDRGADIVVATPGRLNDILEMKKIDFRQISLLVLDEADRMLDMGFEPQIRKIVNEIPPRRQTLMYTATWPKEVRKIASDLLVNPVQVNIGNVDELSANKSITQYVEVVPQMEKECRLEQILRAQETGSKVIVFCSTKRLCDQLARSIGRQFGAAAIHGDKSQVERDSVLNQFKSGKSPILVATDVAARGLDIKDIRVVINYDFPTGVEDYVHRIGRTGRAGATGISYTFFSEQDWKYAPDLIKVLEGANQQVPPEIREMALRGGPALGKDRGGMNRFDSGGGRWESGSRGGMRDGGFGGRGGMRDGGFGGRGGMRDGNFGGRGGMRDGNFGGRGGMRDGNFGGRGGIRDGGFGGHSGMRDGHFGGRRGGRNDLFSGRGNRGRGFGNYDSWGRSERGPRGRGRGRFDDRREMGNRSNSRSPDRVRTWGYSRSRSRSRSWSKSRSRSRSWSRGRSRSYSRSPRRSRSYSRSPRRSRSRSRSYERPRKSRFDEKEVSVAVSQAPESGAHDNAPSLAVESCVLPEEASAIEAVPET